MNIEVKLLSSLEKVFSAEAPSSAEYTAASCLKGERFSFQLACFVDMEEEKWMNSASVNIRINSGLQEHIRLYTVTEVPVRLPRWNSHDDYFLRQTPGLYPDLLEKSFGAFKILHNQWRGLWVEVEIPQCAQAGRQDIEILLFDEKENLLASRVFELTIIGAVLPEQKLMCTQWFHCDCLSTYYKVEALGEEHWRLIENYFANYAAYGGSMVLTPMFTPALDTEIGAERPTVQLVDIEETDNGYSFCYKDLDRYMDLAEKYGIRYFEMAHLFTQWGAKFTPKIVLSTGKRIFGWDVPATDDRYVRFINSFLLSLKAHLTEKGRLSRCFFHVSDEPSDENLESYRAALEVVQDVLAGCNMIDALSEYKFYEMGLVKTPVPANNAMETFIEQGVEPLWTYYCCCQGDQNVSNRFMAMPSSRNRILGLQLYKFNVKGFLHWGYNFWYSQNSRKEIDPYFVTDAGEAFPAGDPFLVYPGADGKPAPSIRQMVFHEALQDQRALSLLEEYMGRDAVISWLEALSGQEITFTQYPHGSEYLLFIREEINKKIADFVQ